MLKIQKIPILNSNQLIMSNKNTLYIPPSRTQKLVPCDCQACNRKLVDPRTRVSHAKRSIVLQREIEELTNSSLINPIYSLKDLMDISNEKLRKQEELHEESYSFLVRRPVTSQ